MVKVTQRLGNTRATPASLLLCNDTCHRNFLMEFTTEIYFYFHFFTVTDIMSWSWRGCRPLGLNHIPLKQGAFWWFLYPKRASPSKPNNKVTTDPHVEKFVRGHNWPTRWEICPRSRLTHTLRNLSEVTTDPIKVIYEKTLLYLVIISYSNCTRYLYWSFAWDS